MAKENELNVGEVIPDQEDKANLRIELYNTLFVDVDSCLSGIEGIDELGRIYGKTEEISQLTKLAMNGEVPFENIFRRRLDLIKPRYQDLLRIGQLYIQTLTPDTENAFAALSDQGVDIFLLSGGFDVAIYPVSRFLGIDDKYVLANVLYFDENGKYAGFDETNPLCRSGGKKAVIEELQRRREAWGKIAIVGDAVSEVETAPVTDLRIGFGGHVVREKVRNEADIFINQCSFAPLVPLLIGGGGIRRIIDYQPFNRNILHSGFEMLQTIKFNSRASILRQDILEMYGKFPD